MNIKTLRSIVLGALPLVSLAGAAAAHPQLAAVLSASGVPGSDLVRDCSTQQLLTAHAFASDINGNNLESEHQCRTDGAGVGETFWTGSASTNCDTYTRHRVTLKQANTILCSGTSNQFGTGFPSSTCWNSNLNANPPQCMTMCKLDKPVQFAQPGVNNWSPCVTRTIQATSLGQGHP